MLIKKHFLFVAGLVLSVVSLAYGEPSVNPTTNTWSHKSVQTISGSGFGIKDPAAPLKWDDCEDKTTNSYNALISEYSDAQPAPSREGEVIPTSHQIMYRNAPYTAVSTPVTPPHSRSTKFIVGGHHEDYVGAHSGRDVQITVATPTDGDTKQRWFVTWYYTLDTAWPMCGSLNNHKTMTIQSGTKAYSNTPYNNQYFYMNYTIFPSSRLGYTGIGTMVDFASTWCGDWYRNPTACNSSTYMGDGSFWRGNSPADGNWIRFEYRIGDDIGFLHCLVDNHYIWKGDGRPNWVSESTSVSSGIRSFTVGGYYRLHLEDGDGAGVQDNDAFRYFDDIYVDCTLARVMLGNGSDYESCTVLEPQIPMAWSNTEVTFQVNLGKLPNSGTAYLYVFDANNEHNPSGTPVTIGDEILAPAPNVTILSPTSSATYSISENSISIGGTVSDNDAISTVTWSNSRGGSGTVNDDSGDWTSWSVEEISLQEGENIISVTATDEHNQSASDTIAVTYTSSNTLQAWNASQQTGDNTWGDSWVTHCVRLLVEGSHISTSGNSIQLGFQGRSADDYTIRKVSIAERDTNGEVGDVVDSTWTRVTFDGNSTSTWSDDVVTIPSGAEKLSDVKAFELEAGKDFYVTFTIESPSVWLDPAADYRELYFETGDHTEDLDWSGLGFSSAWDFHAFSSIYVVPATGGTAAPSIPTIKSLTISN